MSDGFGVRPTAEGSAAVMSSIDERGEAPYGFRWVDELPADYAIGRCPHNVAFIQNWNRPEEVVIRGPEGGWHSLNECIALGWLTRRSDSRAAWMRFVHLRFPPRRVLRLTAAEPPKPKAEDPH